MDRLLLCISSHGRAALNSRSVLQARLHELAQAEEGLQAAQAAFNQVHASLQAMAAAAQQYKR